MRSTIQYIKNELAGLYHPTEISGFVRLILESVYDLTYTDQVLNKDTHLPGIGMDRVRGIVARLKNYEPIQYILGETWFCGIRLKVVPGVLIPRPETEELVEHVLKLETKPGSRILDIGTGSACIALALKNGFPEADVEGVDVSGIALKIAKENARINNLNVQFSRQDILKWQASSWPDYDLVVSNPPYVRESEKTKMEANVLQYEPETALFVTNSDPLLFYRTIAAFAQAHLKTDGHLFFEINEYLAKEMRTLLEDFGFKQIKLSKDVNGRDRIIGCQK